jgi:hypothetical protein
VNTLTRVKIRQLLCVVCSLTEWMVALTRVVTELTYHRERFAEWRYKYFLMSRRAACVASFVAATTLIVPSCTNPVTPLPDTAAEFVPETVYREWWHQMEECSGRTASFDDVRWYVVPGEEPFHVAGVDHAVVAYWDPRGNRIVVLQYLPNQRAPTIRHEALHAILRRTDHPPEFFVDRCGAVIDSPDSPDLPPG